MGINPSVGRETQQKSNFLYFSIVLSILHPANLQRHSMHILLNSSATNIIRLLCVSFLVSLFVIGCSPNDPPAPEPEQEEETVPPGDGNTTEEEDPGSEEEAANLAARQDFFATLTLENSQVWKIISAVYQDAMTTVDLTDNPGITDDELIFAVSGSSGPSNPQGSLTWRKRKGFDVLDNYLNDAYQLPEAFTFEVNEEIRVVLPELELELSENAVVGKMYPEAGNTNTFITITLAPKTSADYKVPPSNLSFSFLGAIQTESGSSATGIVASATNHQLYVSSRDDANSRRRNIYKFDIGTGATEATAIDFTTSEFISSRLHVYNDQLIVMGSAHISELALDFSGTPQTMPNGLGTNLSRAGSAMANSRIYVIGGDVPAGTGQYPPLRLRAYDAELKGFEDVFVFDQERTFADGDIIDDNLYIFGGLYTIESNGSTSQDYYDNLLVYNLSENTHETIVLPRQLNQTSVARAENLLFVSSTVFVNGTDRELAFGVFNTHTKTYNDLSWTLNDEAQVGPYRFEAIYILDQQLFAIIDTGSEMRIYSAPLE